MELFPTESLVYLTADSPNVLESVDPKKVYIMGGIVDRNRLKGITFEKAQVRRSCKECGQVRRLNGEDQ